jgi:hypothetical protein
MKRLILIFCEDGEAGKALAETLRTETTTAQLRDASGVDLHFRIEDCDNVVIMPDVAGWKRRVLERVYDGFVLAPVGSPGARTIRHKGFGRWFVMDGEREISGPHTKEEAERLAA